MCIIKEAEIEHLNSGKTCIAGVELTADDYSSELNGLSLSLSDDIGLNLVMQLSDSLLIDKDNAYVEFIPEGSKKIHTCIS